ncbi:hypothetical protein DY000_02052801 [Brassica cretica]|uniref:Uncharacterized protein n=1 Tax=Brassica cretica TaxID=69181 RepID=A0ABQ7AC38_BRACR|nr:hypothetical protein DY000_02052801 [Brassica cretica]
MKISLDGKQTEKASSVQSTILYDCDTEALSRLFRPRPVSSFDDQVEVLFRVSTVPWVQISRSNARYSTGKSEELSRSLRRFCPSPDQSVEACQFLHGEAEVPVTWKLDHGRMPALTE